MFLTQVLYSTGKHGDGLQATRLSALLNSALGIVAKNTEAAIDLDAIPVDAVDTGTALKFLMSEKAGSLRALLEEEAVNAGDILFRQASRKAFSHIINGLPRSVGALFYPADRVPIPLLTMYMHIFPPLHMPTSRPPFFSRFLPKPENLPLPILLPAINGRSAFQSLSTPAEALEIAAPKLSREEVRFSPVLLIHIFTTVHSKYLELNCKEFTMVDT